MVIKDSQDTQKLPPVFTVLPDESDIRTEANLTKALSDARQSGDSRITPEFIRDVLHPLYKNGQLRNQQDLSDLLNKGEVGPSAKELLDDKIYDGFAHASAMKNLLSLIDKATKD